MKPFVKLSPKKTTDLLVIMSVLSAAAVVAGTWHTLVAKTATPIASAVPNTPRPSFFSQGNVIAGESITLTPRGFEPVEISRQQIAPGAVHQGKA